MMIILGLGNPGAVYARNRHNVGFMILDHIADQQQLSFREKKMFHASVVETSEMILAKPDTFMNGSGKAAQVFTREYKGALVVVHDDIDVMIGVVKCSFARGAGGHNGVQSIIDHLGHNEFFRIRVGVRPVSEQLLASIVPPDGFEKFLLSDFSPMEEDLLRQGIGTAVEIVGDLSKKTFEEIMNKYN